MSFFALSSEITFEIMTASGFPIWRYKIQESCRNVPVTNERVWHVTETKMTPGWMEIKSFGGARALKCQNRAGKTRGETRKIRNLVAARFDSFEM